MSSQTWQPNSSLLSFCQKGNSALEGSCLHLSAEFYFLVRFYLSLFIFLFFCFLFLTRDLGLKPNMFINVIVSLCISRFRSDSWKWHRSRYGSFSMPLWQAKMLILPGRRPYTRSSASWTVRSQRFLNLPIVCRSFCMSSDLNCLPSIIPYFQNLYKVRGSIPIFKSRLILNDLAVNFFFFFLCFFLGKSIKFLIVFDCIQSLPPFSLPLKRALLC